jgi:phage terminase small subunit
MEEANTKPLTGKMKKWADAYLVTLNKTEAARLAGYKGKPASLSQIGWENYRKLDIQAYLKDKFDKMGMPADEAVARLSMMGQASIEDYIDILPGGRMILMDFEGAKEAGVLGMIKKLKISKEGPEIELYDAQAAIRDILKIHGKFKDSVTNLNFNASDLTDEQLQRIASGEDPLQVISSDSSGSGA